MTGMDDDDWLEGLAGRGSSDSPAHREGLRLRAALGAVAQRQIPEEALPDRRREDQLVRRARLDGLLPPRSTTRTHQWFALAACLALAAVGTAWYRKTGTPVLVTRSADAGVVRVEVADPAAEQRAFIDALRAAGATVRSYQMLGRFGVDADLPRSLPAEVRARMQSYRLQLPADGTLQMEFVENHGP